MAAIVATAFALSQLSRDRPARVVSIGAEGGIGGRLRDLGFIAGEAVRVTATGFGGDPIAVRIGDSTFALRRAEAACVLVRPE
jgi:ferrous iron transport protein A